jgi:hypothetical protein
MAATTVALSTTYNWHPNGLMVPPHDCLINSYTGSNLTQTIYKRGGASGEVVATVTYTYDGSSNLETVTVAW